MCDCVVVTVVISVFVVVTVKEEEVEEDDMIYWHELVCRTMEGSFLEYGVKVR